MMKTVMLPFLGNFPAWLSGFHIALSTTPVLRETSKEYSFKGAASCLFLVSEGDLNRTLLVLKYWKQRFSACCSEILFVPFIAIRTTTIHDRVLLEKSLFSSKPFMCSNGHHIHTPSAGTVNEERFAGLNFHVFHGVQEYHKSFSVNISTSL